MEVLKNVSMNLRTIASDPLLYIDYVHTNILNVNREHPQETNLLSIFSYFKTTYVIFNIVFGFLLEPYKGGSGTKVDTLINARAV